MENKARNIGLDFAKLIACVFVVYMHTFRMVNTSVTGVVPLYYLTRCSMPIFFMATGYIQLNSNRGGYKYAVRKIKNILICGFGWAVIDAFVRFIVTKDYVMSLKTIIGWPFGKGALAQFWFLGTMMMIYIVLIPLKKICKKNLWPVLAVFITICAIEDVVNLIRVVNGADTFIQKTISQPFRLWTWITYILIGAVLQRIQSKVSFRKLICACAIFTPCAIGWMYYLMYYKTDIIDGSYMYDSLIVMLWSSIMFLTLVSIPFSSEKVKRNVVNCGKFLIPVYALHYEFIRIAVMFYGFKQPWMQICLGVVVIFIAILCGMVIDKIPYLRRINSL